MEFVLENPRIRLTVTEKAGEMASLYDKENKREVLYQGDEGWSGSNPSLFPLVGNTWSGTYEIDGQEYAMKNHGLVRYATLKGVQDEEKVSLTLESDEATRAQYPFDFKFVIEYSLHENEVQIDYRITNTGSKVMPFTFGLHPAFKVEEDFGQYELDYRPKGPATQIKFMADLSPVRLEPVVLDRWRLDRDEIKSNATIVYKDIQCEQVTLEQNGRPVVTVRFAGFPMLAIWTHPQDSHFLCIEPWYGHADFERVQVPFEKREGMLQLKPGAEWKTGYAIALE